MKYRIDPEFKAYLPPQTKQERAGLSVKIEGEGCAAGAIVVANILGDHVLIDGHNTMEICEEKGIKPSDPRVIKFPTRELVFEWIRKNQLARRNLTDEQRTYYLGLEYKESKVESGKTHTPSGHFDQTGDTALSLAEEHGVSEKTVRRAEEFADAVDELKPAEKQVVLTGQSGLSKQQVINGQKPILCGSCQRSVRVGREAAMDCKDCKQARKDAGFNELGQKAPKPKKADKRGSIVDRLGQEVPDSCRDAFADPALAELIEEVEAAVLVTAGEPWVRKAIKLHDHYKFIHLAKFEEHAMEALHRLQLALESLRSGIPYAVCPKCKGEQNGKVCKDCQGHGYVTEHRHGRLVHEPV